MTSPGWAPTLERHLAQEPGEEEREHRDARRSQEHRMQRGGERLLEGGMRCAAAGA